VDFMARLAALVPVHREEIYERIKDEEMRAKQDN